MKYTFEISIAGCATNCGHCYVNGGPGPHMNFDDVIFCLERLSPVLDRLEGERYITFGNENFCHKRVAAIISEARRIAPDYFTDTRIMPTTGIALARRRDRYEIFGALRRAGTRGFMLALHGSEADHNAVVRNKDGYSALFEAADIMADNGFELYFNLMVSKTLIRGFDVIWDRISAYHMSRARLTLPLYIPTPRMKRYQQNRACADECLKLADAAAERGLDTGKLRRSILECNEREVIRLIASDAFDYEREKAVMPDWKFFNVAGNLDVFYGNVGMHTRRLGNLRDMSDDELFYNFASLGSNYDYTAYYEDEVFRRLPEIFRGLPGRGPNYVYPSVADCIYALLDEMGQRSIII